MSSVILLHLVAIPLLVISGGIAFLFIAWAWTVNSVEDEQDEPDRSEDVQ